MRFYDFKAKKINGQEVSMADYNGKVVLVVNTASKCGLAPQLKGLEELNQKYKAQGLEVLGFPCSQFANQETSDNNEIHEVCQMNFGVTFTMFEKIDVNGESAHPIFKYLKQQKKGLFSSKIKWNFTKFLIDSNGNVIKRFSPQTEPAKIEKDILALLHA